MKKCTKCGKLKPKDGFYSFKRKSDSKKHYGNNPHYTSKCKKCIIQEAEENRQRRKHDPVFIQNRRKYQRKYLRKTKYMKNYFAELKGRWGSTNRTVAFEAERVAVENVLPSLGFSEIFWVSQLKQHFFIDVLAKRNGTIYAVEVCSGIIHQFPKAKWEILKFLGLQLILCFIRPDLQKFRLIEVPPDRTAIAVNNREHLLQEGKIQVFEKTI